MGKHERISTDLPTYMVSELRAAVASGEFASTDEAVREALTHWLVARTMGPMTVDELRLSLQREINEPGLDADVFFDRLEAKYRAMSEADQAKG